MRTDSNCLNERLRALDTRLLAEFDALVDTNSRMGGAAKFTTLYWGLVQALAYGVHGDIVEIGCNAGRTSAFLQTINELEAAPLRTLHLYDSFAGLPAPGEQDGDAFVAGSLRASIEEVLDRFNRRRLAPPAVHPGWFEDTLPQELPPSICFAYVDADFEESIAIALEALYPRLSTGAVVIIDDYCDPAVNARAWSALPGVKVACDTFFRNRPEKLRVAPGGGDLALAYFRKVTG